MKGAAGPNIYTRESPDWYQMYGASETSFCVNPVSCSVIYYSIT